MPDIRKLVTISDTGTVTTVRDLEVADEYMAVRGSTRIQAPRVNQIRSSRSRRYGGGRTVDERHDDGAFSWRALVAGANADDVLGNVDDLLASFAAVAGQETFLEWRPDGATYSSYLRVTGPPSFDLTYEWAQFAGSRSMYVDFTIPTGPLAERAPATRSFSAATTPATIDVDVVPGTAPSRTDLQLLRPSASAVELPFGLIGWWRDTGRSPSGGASTILGTVQGLGSPYGGLALTADADYLGGTGWQFNTTGAHTFGVFATVDPSIYDPDDFTLGTIDIEFWARIEIASTVVSPRGTVYARRQNASSVAENRYPLDGGYGSSGKPIVLPSSGTRFRLTRLGVLTFTCRPGSTSDLQVLGAEFSVQAGSSGTFGLDKLFAVPARARVASRTGVALDSNYPVFIPGTAQVTKTIRHDLRVELADQPAGGGVGGSLIEMAPGETRVFIKTSTLVPDDPVASAGSEAKEQSITLSLRERARHHLARSSA